MLIFLAEPLIEPSTISAFRNFAGLAVKRIKTHGTSEISRNFSQLSIQPVKSSNFASNAISHQPTSILSHPGFLKLSANPALTQVRTVTKFSFKTGKRKSVKAAIKRFKRLDWGIWIRTKSARNKRIWKKSPRNRRKARQHVFTNSTQSWLLDKMVTTYWRRPKHYIDDIYKPYHTREDFPSTRKKPFDWNT
jgi:large subunit ribosomal protein L35